MTGWVETAVALAAVAGLALGSRIFQRIDPAAFRRNVLLLLAALAVAGLARSAF